MSQFHSYAEQLRSVEPLLTPEQAERAAENGRPGLAHRIVLAVLSRSGDELIPELVEGEDAEAALSDVKALIEEHKGSLVDCLVLAEAALERVELAVLVAQEGSAWR